MHNIRNYKWPSSASIFMTECAQPTTNLAIITYSSMFIQTTNLFPIYESRSKTAVLACPRRLKNSQAMDFLSTTTTLRHDHLFTHREPLWFSTPLEPSCRYFLLHCLLLLPRCKSSSSSLSPPFCPLCPLRHPTQVDNRSDGSSAARPAHPNSKSRRLLAWSKTAHLARLRMVHHQAAGGWATTAEGQCVRIKRRVEENGERARIRSGSCCGSLLFLFTRVFLTSGETARSRSETTIVGKSQPSVTPLHVRDPQTSSSCFRIGTTILFLCIFSRISNSLLLGLLLSCQFMCADAIRTVGASVTDWSCNV
jgi:hypothetical protein